MFYNIINFVFYCYYQTYIQKIYMEPRHEDVDATDHQVDYSQMTQAEKEAEFRRQHQQYIAQKMARKKQILKLRKAQFGSSSSDQSDEDLPMGSDSSRSSHNKKQHHNKQSGPQQVPSPKQIKLGNKKHSDNEQKIPVNSLAKKGGQWVKDILVFHGSTISVQNASCDMKIFNKIKIISEVTMGYPYRVKLNYQSSQILFSPSVGINQERNGLPINYYIFARIIQEKLNSDGVKLKQNKFQKIPGVPESLTNNSFIYGRLNKKSQVLGNWQQRFIVINKDGIFSYKKFNEKHTMQIASGSIKQLWTRFQIIDEMLIVKTMHNSKKTEFGFPLCQVLCKNSWLYHFYGAMSKK